MFIEHKCFIGLRSIGTGNKLKNISLLEFFEEAGGVHSDLAKLGVNDIEKTKLSWLVIGWKIQIINRPNYGETLRIKTWSRKSNKFYAFRDYEVFNEKDEIVAKGTSKWILYDIEKNAIATLTEELIKPYNQEELCAFKNEPKYKIIEPEKYERKVDYTITRNMIDINGHVHNTQYMNFAYEAIPKDIFLSEELNNVEISYKKEIKYGAVVKCCYAKVENEHIIVVKDETEKIIHAMIKLF